MRGGIGAEKGAAQHAWISEGPQAAAGARQRGEHARVLACSALRREREGGLDADAGARCIGTLRGQEDVLAAALLPRKVRGEGLSARGEEHHLPPRTSTELDLDPGMSAVLACVRVRM